MTRHLWVAILLALLCALTRDASTRRLGIHSVKIGMSELALRLHGGLHQPHADNGFHFSWGEAWVLFGDTVFEVRGDQVERDGRVVAVKGQTAQSVEAALGVAHGTRPCEGGCDWTYWVDGEVLAIHFEADWVESFTLSRGGR